MSLEDSRRRCEITSCLSLENEKHSSCMWPKCGPLTGTKARPDVLFVSSVSVARHGRLAGRAG